MEKPTRFEKTPELKASSARVDFDTKSLRKFIEDRGLDVMWEKSYLCPCRNKKTGSPDPLCPRCQGRGVAYLPAKEVSVAIQSQEKGVVPFDLGLYDSGTAIGTTQVEDGITFRDRLTLPHIQVDHSLVFDINPTRLERGMFLSYDVHQITFATTLEEELEEGKDFTFDSNRNLFIPEQHLLGKNVSLNVTSTLRYIVIDLLKESRYQYTGKGTALEKFEQLPKKLLLKREDAWVSPTPFSLDDTEPLESPVDMKRDMHSQDTSSGGFFGGVL